MRRGKRNNFIDFTTAKKSVYSQKWKGTNDTRSY